MTKALIRPSGGVPSGTKSTRSAAFGCKKNHTPSNN
jgi:hypothetical protein